VVNTHTSLAGFLEFKSRPAKYDNWQSLVTTRHLFKVYASSSCAPLALAILSGIAGGRHPRAQGLGAYQTINNFAVIENLVFKQKFNPKIIKKYVFFWKKVVKNR